uniref:RING-type domain-containing protein n=1 Tax=Scylla olivacea TaxID=85551 RepID=A0A0P4WDH8_SCYOL
MGDARFTCEQLREERCRINTYGENSNIRLKDDLAKDGFYFTQIGHKVKCAGCGLEVDSSRISSPQEVYALHKEKSPQCQYLVSPPLPQSRTKKFTSYDSLRFEKERLETFIDWPVTWLSPADLAKDGFYYLRTADHCACVFCRGIVGAWEKGDTPREEHQRHFPLCPFIKGQPVGNIPLDQGSIISRITPSPEASPALPLSMDVCSMDVCGSGRPMPGSYPESSPPKKTGLEGIGLPQHSGPKRKDFLSQHDREKSFSQWPEMVKQKPKELAEAGFFYCGLSDHVRCFHCGNGLRNWEKDDDPWEEHARWYPECNYVLVKKGQDFIDKVRREKPPYLRSQPVNKASSSAGVRTNITEQELDPLMELDIIQATLAMGFPSDKVRSALRRKLVQTGLPFLRLETCIEAVLLYMEEETRLALQSSRNVEAEAAAQQGAKMEALQSTSDTRATTTTAATASTSSSSSSSSLSSSAGPSSHSDPGAVSSEEPMETESLPTSPTDDVLSQADQVIGLAEQALNAAPTSSSSPTPNPSTGTSLVTSTNSTPTTPPGNPQAPVTPSTATLGSSSSHSPNTVKKAMNNQLSDNDKPTTSGKPQTSQELAAELEKIRDSHMCKVCMDAEIDMVFLPCAHMVTCSSCALALSQCPICRNDIKYAIKPILS